MQKPKRRIIVIGCPGAGKSAFARKLRDMTGLPLYYLDMIYHKPDRTTVTREEFDPTFRQYILDFHKDQAPQLYELVEQYRKTRRITIFHSREEIDRWLIAQMQPRLNAIGCRSLNGI